MYLIYRTKLCVWVIQPDIRGGVSLNRIFDGKAEASNRFANTALAMQVVFLQKTGFSDWDSQPRRFIPSTIGIPGKWESVENLPS